MGKTHKLQMFFNKLQSMGKIFGRLNEDYLELSVSFRQVCAKKSNTLNKNFSFQCSACFLDIFKSHLLVCAIS